MTTMRFFIGLILLLTITGCWSVAPMSDHMVTTTSGHEELANTTQYVNVSKSPEIFGWARLNWRDRLKLLCVPVLTLVGAIGNTLSFLVMSTKVYQRKSYSYYLRGLAVFDTLTLITALVIEFHGISYKISGVAYLNVHVTWSCKLAEYFRHVIILMSSWLVVFFTVDRYIAVCHPLKRANFCTESRAIIAIVVLFLCACLSQVFRLVYIKRIEGRRPFRHPCHAPKNIRIEYFTWHYFFFSLALRFLLPFIIICICNALIIFHVELRFGQTRRVEKKWEKARKSHMAIYTLYLVCAVFVICLLPNVIVSLIMYFARSRKIHRYLLWFDIPFQMVRNINYCINFLLYGLTGKQFRHQLLRIFWRCRK